MNYYTLLQDWHRQQPAKMLLQSDSACLSYQDFYLLTVKLAAQLKTKLPSALSGGSFLVLADTTTAQLAAFLALQTLNICPILLHHDLEKQEIRAIITANQLQGVLHVKQQHATSAFNLTCELSGLPARQHVQPDILGVLSSGSTGVPKVMYRTYDSWADFFPVQNEIFHVNRNTRLFFHGSLSFTGNLNALLAVLYAGGSLITSQRFHCQQWLTLMQKNHADTVYLIPTKLQLLTAAAPQPLSDVKCLFTGSQLLSQHNINDLQVLFPQAKIVLYYGASELNYITYTVCDGQPRDERNLGKPFPGIGLSFHDGLIYVDTPYQVSGLARPCTIKDTGWLNSCGELIFTGRREAWINKGGVKINTLRLEQKLTAIDGVQAAVVVPCADDLRGSSLAAFIVKDKKMAEPTLRRAIRQYLKPVEIPRQLTFIPQLPLNDRGKVNRKLLASQALKKPQ